ncbi:hypothetical protein [Phreatobacter stygius]|uniref:Uncharacterized protein n=1 Tax=Phreatobacter stygius TaxID=1940610 RepID=A0A4D7B1Z9_9HYPH|nr:hypothetical protein [Phreatobacter stygius]QCI67759.1 hypothetical protein E8M01_28175 [Phreatobacter stygius]
MATETALWLAVVASGLYHGLNPGMGWPLAVAAGMTERRLGALIGTLVPLGAGHLAAVAVVLLPFAALSLLLDWAREIRIGAGLLVVGFAALLLCYPGHPRFMARIRPTQIALWSFLVGVLHGAGLLLVPILLGLCTVPSAGLPGLAAGQAPGLAGNAGLALGVTLIHTAAMLASGGLVAWTVYRLVGLGALTRSWFDLRMLWAASLALAGSLGLYAAF